MRSYYELLDDVYLAGRWQLDGPKDDNARNANEFWQGEHIILRNALSAPIYTNGIPLDFTLTVSDVPVLSRRLANMIRPLIMADTQLFPVHINGHDGFEVMNCLRIVTCLDEHRSEFIKWTQQDGRTDKIGDYRMVSQLLLNTSQIPSDLHVFRIKGWKIALIVSQAFVDAILPLNPTGVKLELVT